jgi:hypothetical protein
VDLSISRYVDCVLEEGRSCLHYSIHPGDHDSSPDAETAVTCPLSVPVMMSSSLISGLAPAFPERIISHSTSLSSELSPTGRPPVVDTMTVPFRTTGARILPPAS